MMLRSKSSFTPSKLRDSFDKDWDLGSSSPAGVNKMIYAMPLTLKTTSPQTPINGRRSIVESQWKATEDEIEKKLSPSRKTACANMSGSESETDTMFDMFHWSGDSSTTTIKTGNLTASFDEIDISNRTGKSSTSSTRRSKKHRHGNKPRGHRRRSSSPTILASPRREEERSPMRRPHHSPLRESANSLSTRRQKKDPSSRSSRRQRSKISSRSKSVDDLVQEVRDLSVGAQHRRLMKEQVTKKSSHRRHSVTSTESKSEDDLDLHHQSKWKSNSMRSARSGVSTRRQKKEHIKKRRRVRSESPALRRSRSVETPKRRNRHPENVHSSSKTGGRKSS